MDNDNVVIEVGNLVIPKKFYDKIELFRNDVINNCKDDFSKKIYSSASFGMILSEYIFYKFR